MDMFQAIRALSSVKKVSSLAADHPQPMKCLFFLCPALSNKSIRLNASGTGVTARYTDARSSSTTERLHLVERFATEARESDVKLEVVAIYATADPLILFSPPFGPPAMPDLPCAAMTNFNAVCERLDQWNQFYCSQPWREIPQRFVVQGEERLKRLLPADCPSHVCDDFVRRVLAGFALDGVLIKSGCFGTNPVLLGVESPEVAVLQNAVLNRDDRIPVIQLA